MLSAFSSSILSNLSDSFNSASSPTFLFIVVPTCNKGLRPLANFSFNLYILSFNLYIDNKCLFSKVVSLLPERLMIKLSFFIITANALPKSFPWGPLLGILLHCFAFLFAHANHTCLNARNKYVPSPRLSFRAFNKIFFTADLFLYAHFLKSKYANSLGVSWNIGLCSFNSVIDPSVDNISDALVLPVPLLYDTL